MSKVSVLLTIFNKPEWLDECIQSVLNQTYQDWELIMIDDNSPDPRVRDIIMSYQDPRIIKLRSNVSDEDRWKTARYATNINWGFNYASGDYITYLVDDDKYYPDRLATLVEYMDANPTHTVVYHAIDNMDAEGRTAGVRGVKGILDGLTPDTQAFDYVDHNAVMHTYQAFIDAGGWYDVPGVWGGADAYFWRRLNESGHLFYPVGDNEHPLGAKRYHLKNVQRLLVEQELFPDDRMAKGLGLYA